jgi:putative peptidoglycan lipid II flippase
MFESLLARAVRVLTVLTVPVTALMILFVEPFVVAVFRFGPEDTALVVGVARAYLLGLLGHSLLEIGARAFYAQQDARTPLRVTAVGLTTFAVALRCSSARWRPMGSPWPIRSPSPEAAILLALLRRSYPSVARLRGPAARTILGTLAACTAALIVWTVIPIGGAAAATISLAVGATVVLPFVLPELRQLAAL